MLSQQIKPTTITIISQHHHHSHHNHETNRPGLLNKPCTRSSSSSSSSGDSFLITKSSRSQFTGQSDTPDGQSANKKFKKQQQTFGIKPAAARGVYVCRVRHINKPLEIYITYNNSSTKNYSSQQSACVVCQDHQIKIIINSIQYFFTSGYHQNHQIEIGRHRGCFQRTFFFILILFNRIQSNAGNLMPVYCSIFLSPV